MKKIIFGIMVLFFAATATAQDQPAASATPATAENATMQGKYFYYPSTNTYYNEASSEYIYYDEPSATWLTVKKLPMTIVVEPTATKYPVTYTDNDVWKENEAHKTKYKVKNDGTKEKTKEKTNDGMKEKTKEKTNDGTKEKTKEKIKD
ncbi:MAG: hypothetical protein ABIO04_06585 [Ferruginibacter sp.]